MNTLSMKKNIVVAGLGSSGTAAAHFLKQQGYEVTATDIDASKRSMEPAMEAVGIKTEIGFHSISTFENAGLIVVSPGIPLTGEHFQKAMERGVPIRGELDLACQYIKEPIIAITGTNGKTTVTTLISEMLTASGKKVFTGGNIGTPLLSYLALDKKADVVVAEVSSFQLDIAVDFAPDVAVLLNITEDHLNRYPDFKAYQASKWSIFAHQKKDDYAIINASILNDSAINDSNSNDSNSNDSNSNDSNSNDSNSNDSNSNDSNSNNSNSNDFIGTLKSKIKEFASQIFLFNTHKKRHTYIEPDYANIYASFYASTIEPDYINICSSNILDKPFKIDISQSPLKGRHNRENIEAAALAALCAGGTIEGIEQAVKQFQGLPHRTEYVTTINGVHFYNDSKATNTDAVARAIESFDSRVILIMGGRQKGSNFSTLKHWISGRVKTIVAMGEAREKIRETFCNYGTIITMADSMAQAVLLAFDKAEPEDTILLSPACASFDMYNNYEHRGEDFIKQVHLLKQSCQEH